MRLVFIYLLPSLLCGQIVDSFYGPLDIEEPVLLELLASPAMERLRHIHQYGLAYYISHKEEYTRYDHSVGVFALLRKCGAPLEEQIAGLLHDVSHTVFSHVGDWLFDRQHEETDYQNSIHNSYLALSGIEEILMRHGYTTSSICPDKETFVMLEQPLPSLCADRLDYNIQGAYFQNFLTKEECLTLYENLSFESGCWLTEQIDLLKKLSRFSCFMTKDCWSSPLTSTSSVWLAQALRQGLDTNLLSLDDIHFGYDDDIWNRLSHAEDPVIKKLMYMITHAEKFYTETDSENASVVYRFKCRGIDPWIVHENKIIRLSSIDQELAQELLSLRAKAEAGWAISLRDPKLKL